jgi:large subunit ribosomal protein L22
VAFGVKTNERPGTRAQVRYARMSAYKAREVLDLIRGSDVRRADEILQFTERDAALVIRKCLASAVANAEKNDQQVADELFVSACFADEGPTLKRWRPRARGRATRIRKRTCHITVIVSRLPDEELARRRAADTGRGGRGRRGAEDRRRRVARSRGEQAPTPTEERPEAAAADDAAERRRRRVEGSRRSRRQQERAAAEPAAAGATDDAEAEEPTVDEAAVEAEEPTVDDAAAEAEEPTVDDAAVEAEEPTVDDAAGEPAGADDTGTVADEAGATAADEGEPVGDDSETGAGTAADAEDEEQS